MHPTTTRVICELASLTSGCGMAAINTNAATRLLHTVEPLLVPQRQELSDATNNATKLDKNDI